MITRIILWIPLALRVDALTMVEGKIAFSIRTFYRKLNRSMEGIDSNRTRERITGEGIQDKVK